MLLILIDAGNQEPQPAPPFPLVVTPVSNVNENPHDLPDRPAPPPIPPKKATEVTSNSPVNPPPYEHDLPKVDPYTPEALTQIGWQWPLKSYKKITSHFGVKRGTSTHKGIDITAKKGTPVYPIGDGIVIDSRHQGHDRSYVGATDGKGWGNLITVKHPDGMRSLYAHLQKRLVSVGTAVYKDSIVGTINCTGGCRGNPGDHLHLEIFPPGSKRQRNPLVYITPPTNPQPTQPTNCTRTLV